MQKSLLHGALCCLFAFAFIFKSSAYDLTNETYYPVLTPPKHLYVAAIWNTGQSDLIGMPVNTDDYHRTVAMLESLSGIALKLGNTNGIYIEANSSHRLILEQLSARRGISYEYIINPQTPWDIVDMFKDSFDRKYVLYDLSANPGSLDAARMASYKFNAILVDKSLEPIALAHGLTNAMDCSALDDQWIYDNWWPTWPRKDLAVEQTTNPGMAQYRCLNDYASAVGAPAFYQGANTALRSLFIKEMDDDSPILGWGNFDEIEMTTESSLRNTSINAADHCYNLALLSSLRDKTRLPLQQKTHSNPTNQSNVHYVAFVWTDGDNIQWFHNDFQNNPQWFGSPLRGQVTMGWGISPAMRDLSPTMVEGLYDSASNSVAGRDFFVAMSSIGYCYPSHMSATARQTNAIRLNKYMADMDTRLLVLLDKNGFDNVNVYRPYLEQPNIDAILYWDVLGDYGKYHGEMKWLNGKPIISARIWMRDLNGTVMEPQEVANDLNSRPRNPASPSGYSIVPVHAWSMSVADVQNCVSLLDTNVKVVTPEELVKLVMTNIAPQVPTIQTNPASQVVPLQTSVILRSSVTGTAPLSYQWFFNGQPLAGRTSTATIISPITLAHAGAYTMTASNAYGVTESLPARLSVQAAPTFNSNCIPAPDGLLNWWTGDGNTYDLITGLNGRQVGGSSFATGQVGIAFNCDGSSGAFELPFNSSYDFRPSDGFTLMAWVKSQPLNRYQAIAVKSPGSGEWDWGLYINPANQFMSGRHNLHIITSSTTVQAGSWYHVAVTYSNASWALYVNGVREGQTNGTHITQSLGGLTLGRKGESLSNFDYYQGMVDEFQLYNRSLSPTEIQSVYNAGSAGLCKQAQLSIVKLPNSTNVQLSVEAPIAYNLRLESSSTLTNWTLLKTFSNPEGTVLINTPKTNALEFFRVWAP